MIPPNWFTMDGAGNIEIHTPEPIPIEHVFRVVCGLRKTTNEKLPITLPQITEEPEDCDE